MSLATVGNNLDSRYTMASGIRRQINKVFPTHWSFMLGDVDDDAMHNPDLRAKALSIGTQWAHVMGIKHAEAEELDEALSPLINRLREMGFDPTETEEANSLALHSCPFVVNDKRPSAFVCAIHAGFIQESLGENNRIQLELKPLNAPGTCKVHVMSE